jgi:hypothetical protein
MMLNKLLHSLLDGKNNDFLMISPNLHDIWVVFFLNLSQELKFVLLLYFGTLGDGYSLKGSKK